MNRPEIPAHQSRGSQKQEDLTPRHGRRHGGKDGGGRQSVYQQGEARSLATTGCSGGRSRTAVTEETAAHFWRNHLKHDEHLLFEDVRYLRIFCPSSGKFLCVHPEYTIPIQ